MKKEKIFISGGAGVIGQELVHLLLNEGVELFVGDLKPCPPSFQGKLHYREGDLNSLRLEELAAFKPTLFIHLAATFERSLETADFFEENFHHNILLSHHLLKLSREVKSIKKIVFASSYLIYDPKLYLFEQAQKEAKKLNESETINPRNLCGASKLFFERELELVASFEDLAIISARIFRGYGKNSNDIISRWVRALIKGEELNVYRAEGRFDYIYAADTAMGLFKLAGSDFRGIVNLGSGHSRSVLDILNILKGHFGDFKMKEVEVDMSYEASVADMENFKKIVNWMPTHSLEEGIEAIVEYESSCRDKSSFP